MPQRNLFMTFLYQIEFLKRITVQLSSQSLRVPLILIHKPRHLSSVAAHLLGPVSLLLGCRRDKSMEDSCFLITWLMVAFILSISIPLMIPCHMVPPGCKKFWQCNPWLGRHFPGRTVYILKERPRIMNEQLVLSTIIDF